MSVVDAIYMVPRRRRVVRVLPDCELHSVGHDGVCLQCGFDPRRPNDVRIELECGHKRRVYGKPSRYAACLTC